MAKKTLKRNQDGEKLRMYLLTLPLKDSSKMVVRLAEACKVPLHTVHNWRGGLCRIPELAKDKIEEVTGVKIFLQKVNKYPGRLLPLHIITAGVWR